MTMASDMERKPDGKMRWAKLDLDLFADPAIGDLVDAYGAAGVGVWLAAMVALYQDNSKTHAPMARQKFLRRVARTVGGDAVEVSEICGLMAELGLLDAELWERGSAANERVVREVIEYGKRAERAARAAAARWGDGGAK